MANYKVVDSDKLDSDLKRLADIIRLKGGTVADLSFPEGMQQAVQDIQAGTVIPEGYIKPSGNKKITENGKGIDVTQFATVDVEVADSGGGGSGGECSGEHVIKVDTLPEVGVEGAIYKIEGAFCDVVLAYPSYDMVISLAEAAAEGLSASFNTIPAKTTENILPSDGETSFHCYYILAEDNVFLYAEGEWFTLEEALGSPFYGFISDVSEATQDGLYAIGGGTSIHQYVGGEWVNYVIETPPETPTSFPLNISTEEAMAAILTNATEEGEVYKYVGESTDAYISNALYIVVAVDTEYVFARLTTEGVSMGLSYTLKDDGTYEVNAGSCIDTDVVIPSSVNGRAVTSIGSRAFQNNTNIKSVVISEGITSIGSGAFGDCTSLIKASVPNSLTKVDGTAFLRCSNLVKNRYDNAWYLGNDENPYVLALGIADSSATTCEVAPGTRVVGYEAFRNWSNLVSVVVPNSVVYIADYAFSYCSGLTDITIGTGLKAFGSSVFNNSYKLANIYISDLTRWIERDNSSGYVFINNSKYTYNLYLNNELVTDVVIPSSMTKLKKRAFENCKSIKSVVVGNNVTEIADGAFINCTGLISATLSENVSVIGSSAFQNCSSLESVNLPAALTNLPSSIFSGCGALTSINIPSNITKIPSYAFRDCTKLSIDIVIPGSVTKIEDYAFNSSGITSITIPSGVTDISGSALIGCRKLSSITVASGNTKYTSYEGNLYNKDRTQFIQYALGSSASACTVPQGVTSIKEYAFKGCSNLVYLVIPDSVKDIGLCAFQSSANLKRVRLPSTITRIGYEWFEDCSKLASIIIPNGVTEIGHSAFHNCSALKSIVIPKSVTTVGSDAFYSSGLLDVHYTGTEAEWATFAATISSNSNNSRLTGASVTYNYVLDNSGVTIPAGTYTLNETLTTPTWAAHDMNFTSLGSDNAMTYNRMVCSNDKSKLMYRYDATEYTVYDFVTNTYSSNNHRQITLPKAIDATELFGWWFMDNVLRGPMGDFIVEIYSYQTGREYYFVDYGMTWAEWISSDYNTAGYTLNSDNNIISGRGKTLYDTISSSWVKVLGTDDINNEFYSNYHLS